MNNKIIFAGVVALILVIAVVGYTKIDSHHADEDMSEHTNNHTNNGHDESETPDMEKGPHGGWFFEENDFSLEVLIFEKGIPPEFRVYAYANHEPVDPKDVYVSITLNRLGKAPENIKFKTEREYLLGEQEIYEPHSFDVLIEAKYKDQSYSWTKQQIEGRIEMDKTTLERTGVEISTAGSVVLQESTDLPGEIRFNQDRLAHVVSSLSGIVTVNPKRLGEQVDKDELLTVIESQELVKLKSDYLAARERHALAKKLFNREKQLRDEGISAEQDFFNSETQLAEAKINLQQSQYVLSALGVDLSSIKDIEDLSRYEIRSPISGVIINKHVSQGEAVTSENTLFVLADLSEVWVEFTVYPRHLTSVHVGQSVSVEVDAINQSLSGTVAWIGPLVGDETRSAKAYVTLENPDRVLRPGLFVNVKIENAQANIPVAVKHSAIQTYNDWKVVFIRKGDQFEVRPIEQGRQDDEWVEVLSGLESGTEYVSTNSFLFKAELGKSSASHDH
tara:strand:+ start:1150 stop:2661 length:1512 start_codon:yes stop_codon:yes gene_type:complete